MMQDPDRRLLFVDDDPNILNALQRMLRPLHATWDMHFAENGEEALKILAIQSFDVVVSDMRMPGMDGNELLSRVKLHYPHIVRIILSGHCDQGKIVRSVGLTHQFLAKPCEAELLKQTVARACGLRDVLSDSKLTKLVSSLDSVPSLPSLYAAIMEELNSEGASIQRVGDIISRDPGMTAKVLQLINSAYFGLRRHIANPTQAVNYLGLEIVKALVITVPIFSELNSARVPGLSLDRVWSHSMSVSVLARKIANDIGTEASIFEAAFTAGLLHDIGKLILAVNLPDEYRDALLRSSRENIPVWQAEEAVFGTTHAHVGAYLLGLWGLPIEIVEAVAFHHQPTPYRQNTFSPLSAVRYADYLHGEVEPKNDGEIDDSINAEMLAQLGSTEIIEQWKVIAGTQTE